MDTPAAVDASGLAHTTLLFAVLAKRRCAAVDSLDERLCLAENTALCLACAACGGRAIRQPLHDRGRLGDNRWRCCPRTRHAIASQKMNSSDDGSLPA